MIAYRAEIWCDGKGCDAGWGDGITHNDHTALPVLASNLEEIRVRHGWTSDGKGHWCPTCSAKRAMGGAKDAK